MSSAQQAQTTKPGKQVASMSMGVIDTGGTNPKLEEYRFIADGAARTATVILFAADGLSHKSETITVGASAIQATDNALYSGDWDAEYVGMYVLAVSGGSIYTLPCDGSPVEVTTAIGVELEAGSWVGMVPAALREERVKTVNLGSNQEVLMNVNVALPSALYNQVNDGGGTPGRDALEVLESASAPASPNNTGTAGFAASGGTGNAGAYIDARNYAYVNVQISIIGATMSGGTGNARIEVRRRMGPHATLSDTTNKSDTIRPIWSSGDLTLADSVEQILSLVLPGGCGYELVIYAWDAAAKGTMTCGVTTEFGL